MTKEDREVLRDILREVLNEHKCRFSGISDEDVPHVVHTVGMTKDIGTENIRDNHKWLRGYRESLSKATGVILTISIVTLTTGAFAAVWLGIKEFLSKRP